MNSEVILKTGDVFGISRDIPLNYITRNDVDAKFNELDQKKHIVIYGSSKQGKTCLRKKCLNPDEYILIQCSNKWNISDLNSNILKRADFELTQSEKVGVTGKNKIIASLSAKIFGIGSNIAGEKGTEETSEKVTTCLEIDMDDVNDVISAMQSIDFDKLIILEDFHYLKPETQKDFSIELKAFHENSKFCFIIIGVWLEENRLISLNGDLQGRITSVNVDKWKPEELVEVIDVGASLLNVEFSALFKKELIRQCNDSVYIVQEVCNLACKSANVYQTMGEHKTIPDMEVKELVIQIIEQQSARYQTFVNMFSEGFQDTTLEMYKWLLYPVLFAEEHELERGFKYADIRKKIQAKHPRGADLNPGNLTQALKSCASLQISKNITPLIMDYDVTNTRLLIVDRGFIIWLRYQDRGQLLADLSLPTD